MAMIDEIPWHELATPGRARCRRADGRVNPPIHDASWRRSSAAKLYRWNHLRVDMVVEPTST